MNDRTGCPKPDVLLALIDSQLSDAEQAGLVGHLDTCITCQQSLQELANGGRPLAEPMVPVDQDQPPPGSAYWPTVAQLKLSEGSAFPPDRATIPSPSFTASSGEPVLDFLDPAEEPGTLGRLERFHILRVVGRGGMGMVLEALDACLQRKVAIKVMDPQLARDEISRKRFCREARAAAAVVHENVVTIHQVDIKADRDLPYLVMQYVTGQSLQDMLDRTGPLPIPEIVRIGEQVARGLAAAHEQGLIHRDIKPANVLLARRPETATEVTGRVNGSGASALSDGRAPLTGLSVKISDFGLARSGSGEDMKLTQTGFVAGTPLYMAPEQARGEPLDARTDLFSLGGVLYAMCTGEPPFEASTPYLVLRRVTDEKPRPIEEINPDVPDWLIGVIARLLEKKPSDRFQSAAEVADLLALHLHDLQKPPPLPTGRSLRQFLRSNRGMRSGTGLRWWQAALVGAGTFLLLLGCLLLSENQGWTHLLAGRNAEQGPPARNTLQGNGGPIFSAAFSPDDRVLAMGMDDGNIKLWDLIQGRVRATIPASHSQVWSLAYSPDGAYLASAGDEGTIVWNTATLEPVKTLKNSTTVRAVAFSPVPAIGIQNVSEAAGPLLATGSRDGRARLWKALTGEEIGSFLGHRTRVMSVAFSPDGRTLATASGDKTIKLWDVESGHEQLTLQPKTEAVFTVAFSPDGKLLASGGGDRIVRLWDPATGEPVGEMSGHAGDVRSLAFSPDSRLLATASEDHTVKLWDVEAQREVITFRGHNGMPQTVTFSHDGHTVASGSRDGAVKLWNVPAAR